jgi:2-aminoethylphosphonate-pyruvate transaminase
MKKVLLTPGPLTTADVTRSAMDRDWGSRDRDFVALTRHVRDRLCDIANADKRYACVPLQGSGTFAVEAAIQTLVPRDGKLLVLINGAYGHRIVEIAGRVGRRVVMLEAAEDSPISAPEVAQRLLHDKMITDVAVVHCETTSGILNRLEAIAATVCRQNRRLLVDAMSSFGGVPIDTAGLGPMALIASANKCLEGVPGIAFVIATVDALEHAEGNASSPALDLERQWRGFEADGQWRFTPPTQVLAALDAALDELEREGGVAGRNRRYARNCHTLIEGIRSLGFRPFLNQADQAPIIVTFAMPTNPGFVFDEFYDRLHDAGYVIYPGKLTGAASFRISCIGAIDSTVIEGALAAISAILRDMAMPTGDLYK